MILLIFVLAGTMTYYRDQIKGLESYSIFSQVPEIKYQLSTKDENNNNLDTILYQPHVSSFTGVGVSTEYFGVSITYQNEDENKKDVQESDLFDLQLTAAYKFFL